jgi:c-di-GMP-binding flagellar brake protein YcgR
MTTTAERRKYRRYDLSIEVQVKPNKRAASAVRTVTRDISARGVYFDFPENMQPGSDLEFELNLPPELAAGKTVRIHCRGKIVRVETAASGGPMRVAASIESYEFLRPE